MDICFRSMVLVVGILSGLVAAEEGFASGVDVDPNFQDKSSMVLPVGATLREVLRLHRSSTNTHATFYFWPDNWEKIGWRIEGSLGFVSSTPFDNSAMLYQCFVAGDWNYFSSRDPGCEGAQTNDWAKYIGYVSTVRLPGTVPVYRCVFKWKGKRWRHFDSHQADCEGNPAATNEGILGYVFM